MKPGFVRQLLNLPEPTLRKWSNDFGEYLSVRGRGGEGRKRNYMRQDVQIIMLIGTMKADNLSEKDIHTNLSKLRAEGWQTLPDLPSLPSNVAQVMNDRRDNLRKTWAKERQKLEEKLDTSEARLLLSYEDHAKTRQELGELNQRYGEAVGRLSERHSNDFWMIVLAIAVVSAVLVTVAVIVIGRI